MTRAKFKCISVSKKVGWGDHEFLYAAELTPVYAGGDSPQTDENKRFWAASPSGSLKLDTVRDDHFMVGKSYYVDFSDAPD